MLKSIFWKLHVPKTSILPEFESRFVKNKRKKYLLRLMEDIPEINYPFVLNPKDFAYFFENSCLYPITCKQNKNYYTILGLSRLYSWYLSLQGCWAEPNLAAFSKNKI